MSPSENSNSLEVSPCSGGKLYDVIVVGAGLSGVTVAKLLKQNNVTSNVLLLEANDYIGGRLRSQTVMNGKAVIDIGGLYLILHYLIDFKIALFNFV